MELLVNCVFVFDFSLLFYVFKFPKLGLEDTIIFNSSVYVFCRIENDKNYPYENLSISTESNFLFEVG